MKVVDPRATLVLLKGSKIAIVLMSLLLFPVISAVLTSRWWIICRHLGMGVSFKNLYQVYYTSWFIGALPVSGIAFLSKIIYLMDEGKPAGRTVVSLILDKLLSTFGLMAFGLFGLFYFPEKLLEGKLLWTIYGGMILLMCMAILFGRKSWEGLKKILKRYANNRFIQAGRRLTPDLTEFWSSFSLRFFYPILALSIAFEFLRSLGLYILAISLGINVSFGLIVACSAIIGIVNIIPVTVGGLGTRDAILLLALPLSGVSREAALALGMIAFLWDMSFHFSGLVFWLRRPLPSGGILSIEEKLWNSISKKGKIP